MFNDICFGRRFVNLFGRIHRKVSYLIDVYIGFWGIVAGAYVFYICEVFCCSSSWRYLQNMHGSETATQFIEKIQSHAPRIWWKVECYHYRHYKDSKGNSKRKKVVTHRAEQNYAFNSWKDVSAEFTGLGEWNLTKLKNYKTFSFANQQTENDYNYKVQQFRANNDRDRYQDFRFGVAIQDFEKFVLVEAHPGARSGFISLNWYLCSSFLLCTTCYRMYFSSVCGRKQYVFDKQISI